jgi:F-type H+-transporting ATPase subunit gamma
MAKTREIKRRLNSIDKTRQITRTMEMVATSKLKRLSDLVHAARPYSERLGQVIGRLTDPELRARYPLLREPEEVERAAVVLLTSNRGLCGAFNVNLIKQAKGLMEHLESEGVDVDFHVIGKKGKSYFSFQGTEMASVRIDLPDRREPEHAEEIVDDLMDGFREGELDAVYVVYAQFRSALSTPPKTMKVLPVEPPKGEEETEVAAGGYILSPGADEILNELLPLYVRNRVYNALVETAAAEQGARRTAMKNATDNAEEMLEDLRRSFNRARQAQITQEISEIVGGAEALD